MTPTKAPEKTFLLTATVLQNTLNYLAQRPFNEVSVLLARLSEEIAAQQPPLAAVENTPAAESN